MAGRERGTGASLNQGQVDLISAALRHVRDAEKLLQESVCLSVDQAWHRAGFGPECIRKATLGERWADKALGHVLTDSKVWDWALALDPWASRSAPAVWEPVSGPFREWRPEARYDATGTATEPDARRLVEAARQAVDDVVTDLWADGRLLAIPE